LQRASPAQRRRQGKLCAAYLVLALLLLPLASQLLVAMPPFTGVFATAVAVADVCTYALLAAQYRAGGQGWLLTLACAYLYSALMAFMHLLTFPSALVAGAPLLGGAQAVGQIYLLWGTGFALLTFMAVLQWRKAAGDVPPGEPAGRRLTAATLGLMAGTGLLCAAAVSLDTTQAQVIDDHFARANMMLNAMRGLLALAALALLWRGRDRLNVVLLWLSLVLVAAAVGPLLTDLGGRRYTVGWYAGRASFAFASSVLLVVLLTEFVGLYHALVAAVGQLTRQARALRDEMERRQQAERQLLRAQRSEAIGRITAGVAHDFNNLLTTVVANLELIVRTTGDENARVCASRARSAALRGGELTRSLLAFGREQPLLAREVDLAVTLREMHPLLQNAAGEALPVRLTLAPDLWSCRFDPMQFELALLNLVLNAREATATNEPIEVDASNRRLDLDAVDAALVDLPAGDYVGVAIADHGGGIAAEVLDKVFEPFFTTKAAGHGSGLGLSQAQGFARQSGGDVVIDSHPGRGTVVTLWLPRARPLDMRSHTPRAQEVG